MVKNILGDQDEEWEYSSPPPCLPLYLFSSGWEWEGGWVDSDELFLVLKNPNYIEILDNILYKTWIAWINTILKFKNIPLETYILN